jgi:hypothetical protein
MAGTSHLMAPTPSSSRPALASAPASCECHPLAGG